MIYGANAILDEWLTRNRKINWEITLGIDGRKKSVISSIFNTSLAYIDDQGEKWGDTYIKYIGQHFDDYSHWNNISYLLPMGSGSTPFVPTPFHGRQKKGSSPGVTGLIGEVLVTTLLQKKFKIRPFQIAHLMDNRKAPDVCLDIQPNIISNILISESKKENWNSNIKLAHYLSSIKWSYPLPLECKSRKDKGNRYVKKALSQLIEYWRIIPEMSGYGIYAQIDIFPSTKIRLHLLIPKPGEHKNIRKLLSVSSGISKEPSVQEFKDVIGVKLLG